MDVSELLHEEVHNVAERHLFLPIGGYWRQRDDERLVDFHQDTQVPLLVRERNGRPPRGHSGSALLLCVAGVHCWEISLG